MELRSLENYTLVANYGNCHAIAARLTGLQEWVRAQQKLTR